MLLIPKNNLLRQELSAKASVKQYLSDIEEVKEMLLAEKNYTAYTPDKVTKNERFYFRVDVRKNSLSSCNGIARWLGYPDSHFNAKDYLSIIHESHAVAHSLYAIALIDFLSSEAPSPEELLRLTYVSPIALLHKNGKYLYCKKESRPLRVTQDGKILEYCNEFTVIKEFNNELYDFRIYDAKGQRHDLEKKISSAAKHCFEKTAGFSVQELRILKRYAGSETMTGEKIAAGFKIERSTVLTYNKRILDKTENIFGYRFDNAKKVAEYLQKMDLI